MDGWKGTTLGADSGGWDGKRGGDTAWFINMSINYDVFLSSLFVISFIGARIQPVRPFSLKGGRLPKCFQTLNP